MLNTWFVPEKDLITFTMCYTKDNLRQKKPQKNKKQFNFMF